MTETPEAEDTIVYSEKVKAQMAQDPEMAECLRGMTAAMRQAQHDLKTGKYASFEDALEAITGSRPTLVMASEEEAEGFGSEDAE